MSKLSDYMTGTTDTYDPEDEEELEEEVPQETERVDISLPDDPVFGFIDSPDAVISLPKRKVSDTSDSYDRDEILESAIREHNTFYRYHMAREENRLDASLSLMPGIETPGSMFSIGDDPLYSPDPFFNLSQALEENEVEEGDKHRFARVVNEWQFTNVIDNLEQEKADKAVLNDTGFWHGLLPQIVAGTAEPVNYAVMLLGSGLKLGSLAVRGAIEGGLMGGLNASVRGALNNEFSLREAAYEAAATGITAGLLGGAIGGSIAIVKSPQFKDLTKKVKNAVTPNFDEWFQIENGELVHVSSGRFGEVKQKAKRWMWEFCNNSPGYQMYMSGDRELKKLAPLIFRGRNGNFSEAGEVIPTAAEEQINMLQSEENLMMQRIDKHRQKYREGGGSIDQFNKEVVDGTINTYIDSDTGELYFGKLPEEPAQMDLFGERAPETVKRSKNINKYTDEELREIRFYDEEYAEMMGLSKNFEDTAMTDNPHVLGAIRERLNFWRKIINKAKKMGTLDETFGEGGISVERNALTLEMANMPAEAFIKGTQTETLPKTKLVSLGHVMRRYSAKKVHENAETLRPLLAREIHMNSPKLTPNEIENVSNEILARLANEDINARNAAFDDLPAGVKFTKRREVAITDKLLSAANVLDYDTIVYELGSWKELAGAVELDRAARNMGYESWRVLKENYNIEGRRNTGAVVGDDLKTKATSEVYNYNYALLNDVEKKVKGTFGRENFLNGNRVWKWFANSSALAFLSQGGMMMLSMIPDGAMIALRAGFAKSLKRFIAGIPNTILTRLSIPLNAAGEVWHISSLKNMGEWLRELRSNDPELFQRVFGFIEKQIEDTRFVSDLESYARNKKLKRTTNVFTKYGGLDAINRSMRNVAGQEIYDKLITECLKPDAKADWNFLAKMGIGRPDLSKSIPKNYKGHKDIIAEAYRKYGYKNGMTKFINPEDIGDRNAADLIRMSIESALDQTILVPGIGNVPRFLKTSFGKAIYMFASYPYMIFNDVLRPAFGGMMPETHMFSAIGTSYALSITRKLMADACNGKESDPSSWEFWSEVQQYSMLDFYALDVIRRGIDALVGQYGREATDQISPILSFWNGVCDFAGVRKSARAARNMIPGINFWWARPLTNPFLPDINKKGKYTR